ncbi:hypothetical protein SERLA73DRAFT_192228 [Serpula lacrymans var. lacrymans S7.3]|uniref:Uncharacterized protein n=1 Tax=Serpula lacrymans var. lacrymans (strain S7.3) TaxID=936435 RepID=F8QJD4_SERL3|nr:hypothetical protein SERLA73DRAFT_192228 [Serpula lacrymans var. lacrymans S7.3]
MLQVCTAIKQCPIAEREQENHDVMGKCSKKRARQKNISINTVPLLSVRHSKKKYVSIKMIQKSKLIAL